MSACRHNMSMCVSCMIADEATAASAKEGSTPTKVEENESGVEENESGVADERVQEYYENHIHAAGRRPRRAAVKCMGRNVVILHAEEEAEETSSSESEEAGLTYVQEYVASKPFTYEHVRKWTCKLKVPLLHHHVILCPINYNHDHWGLHGNSLRFLRRKTIHSAVYMDSCHRVGQPVKDIMKRYYKEEYDDKKHLYETKSDIKRSFDEVAVSVPHQRNSFDCGVWVCIYAYCMVRGIDPAKFKGNTENQQEKKTSWFRKHMLVSITGDTIGNVVTYPADVNF